MENNEMLEYVKEIKEIEKKRIFWARISAALLGIMVIAIISVLPTLFKTLNNANEAMVSATDAIKNANSTLDQAQDIMTELSGAIDTMEVSLDSMTKFVDEGSESLKTAFDNINSIDFEGLNEAITDLGDVVEPLSNFFRKF